jgi:DNA-binding transcriptional ArsR family regulator
VFGIDRTPNALDYVVVAASSDFGTEDILRDAVGALGLAVEQLPPSSSRDFVLVNPAGGQVVIELRRMSLVSVDGLARRIEEWNRRRQDPDAIGVVIADRVTQDARAVLRSAGWGWLDLRGHLHIAGRGLFIDADVPATRETPGTPAPLTGHVGVEVAALMLLSPDEPAAVRHIAAAIGRAPSSVSAALAGLRGAGLVDTQRKPVLPGLFWELASHWRSPRQDLLAVPSPGDGPVNDALRLGLDDIENTTGWALGDTVAAAAYGAPVGVRSDHPPDFSVPDDATLRRAVRLLGPALDHEGRAATVRVAPAPIVCSRRVDAAGWTTERRPLAQPLFVALDLAQDPGRGAEILAGWTPPRQWRRVW